MNELVVTDEKPKALMHAFEMEDMEEDAGLGASTDPNEALTPIVRLLQTLSPQVSEGDPKYIEGAKRGDIFLRDEEQPIIKGSVGFQFRLCLMWKGWVEWKPRDEGGGFVARYLNRPLEAIEKEPNHWYMPDGNELQDIMYHGGFIIMPDGGEVPYIIPMKGANHTVSKSWLYQIQAKRFSNGKQKPSWMYVYRIKTQERQNSKGKFHVYQVTTEGPMMAETEDEFRQLYARCKAFHEALKAGLVPPEVDHDDDIRVINPADDDIM